MKHFIHPISEDNPAEQPLVLKDSKVIVAECKHDWQLVAKTYASPIRTNATPINTENPRILFGVTTCIWHCATCGRSHKDEILGTDENRWEDIVDKVEKFGMQYIKVGDKVFGVAEWTPPPATNGQ